MEKQRISKAQIRSVCQEKQRRCMAAGQYGEMQRKSIAINRTVGKDERSNEMALHPIDGKAKALRRIALRGPETKRKCTVLHPKEGNAA